MTLYFFAPNPWQIQSTRALELQASVTVLDHGGPALLGYRPGTHTPYAVGYSEDQGIYLIVPVLSHWFGESNPATVMRWLWLVAWTLTMLLSSAVFGSVFRSRWAALLTPPLLLACILSFGFGEIYWVPAWGIVTLMPMLILVGRSSPLRLWVALVAIAFAAGVVTAIRADGGLPVVLAVVAVAAIASGRRPLRLGIIALVVLAYLSPTWIVLPAIREHRDHRIGVNLSAHEPTSHELWHTLYIGLGYTSNRFGIHYLDRYGNAAAHELDPSASPPSRAYESTLHKEVDALLKHDPGFVAKAEVEKSVVELSLAAPYVLLLALLLPTALATRAPARLGRSELALFVPALVIGAVPAVIAAPFRDYTLTLLGPLAALSLLAICSVAAHAEAGWDITRTAASGLAAHARLLVRDLLLNGPRRATMRTLLITLIILLPVSVFARHLEAAHERWDGSEHNPPTVMLAQDRTSSSVPHA